MYLYEEIRKNSGLEVLNEGIKFGKNSVKLKRLAKSLKNKADKVKNNDDVKKELLEFSEKMYDIVDDFEDLETKFRKAKGEDRNKLKTEYKELEKKFVQFLNIIKKEKIQTALIFTGSAAIVTITLIAFCVGLGVFSENGVLDGFAANVNAQKGLSDISKMSGAEALRQAELPSSGIPSIDDKAGAGVKPFLSKPLEKIIDQTQSSFEKVVKMTIVPVATIITTTIVNSFRKIGEKRKVFRKTLEALEDLKRAEKRKRR